MYKKADELFEKYPTLKINYRLMYVTNLNNICGAFVDLKMYNDLSTYFMLISEMKDLPDKLYDFGYDLMTYCEHGPKFDFLWAVEFRDKNWSPTNHLESILKECKV